MRFSVLTGHVPRAEGVAAGRVMRALADGLIAEGHTMSVCVWGSEAEGVPLPAWCEYVPLVFEGGLRAKLRSLTYPRTESARLGWTAADGSVAIADEYPSYPGIAGEEHTVLLQHHLTRLDVLAVQRPVPRDIQRWRAETSAARQADLVVATSARVAAESPRRVSVCPIAYPLQPQLPSVEAPIAAIAGDWRWTPNQWALDRLLRAWPTVRELVPHAELLVAGHGSLEIGEMAGVRGVGAVERALDVLAQAALVPFPCPPSSGPKVKTLEALSLGLPIVTTPAGFEGIRAGPFATEMTTGLDQFAQRVAALLRDPERRAVLGTGARRAVQAHHSPAVAARSFAAACAARFPDLSDEDCSVRAGAKRVSRR